MLLRVKIKLSFVRIVTIAAWKLKVARFKNKHFQLVFNWELSKKFKFDFTNKWYLPNRESILENERNKILWILRYKQFI